MKTLSFRAFVCILALLSTAATSIAQRTISGTITDASTGEQILGASVIPLNDSRGTSTNIYGFYSLTLPDATDQIVVSFIGYQSRNVALNPNQKVYNVDLEPAVIAFEEATVVGERTDHTASTDLGRESVEVDQIKALPALLGEVDVLKVLQFLPGVSSAGEGNSGFYVRGGGPDQNLILLDDATVYNASHLFGFFSVFNADAIKNIDLIKGSMPAEYGGRVSSVLNIGLKEGNSKEWKATGGLGLDQLQAHRGRADHQGHVQPHPFRPQNLPRRLDTPIHQRLCFRGHGVFFLRFQCQNQLPHQRP